MGFNPEFFLLTGPGIDSFLEILKTLVTLKMVIENNEICDPKELTTPKIEQ